MKDKLQVHKMNIEDMDFEVTISISESITSKGLKPCGYQIASMKVSGVSIAESDVPGDVMRKIHEKLNQ